MRERLAFGMALLLGACAGSSSTEDPGGDEMPTTGDYYRYVVDDLILPGSGATADELAFDVDGKGDRTDNALGSIISKLGECTALSYCATMFTRSRKTALMASCHDHSDNG